MNILSSPADAAAALANSRLVSAEFMYRPRPTGSRERQVFDFTLDSRLSELSRYPGSAVVLICNDKKTSTSLAHLPERYPTLHFTAALVNPKPLLPDANDIYSVTPKRCGWHNPAGWQRYDVTDRWARIGFALESAALLPQSGWLMMPAHDAVWGRGLLETLMRLSQKQAQNDLPAAVSPYTYHQHSPVTGIDIPPFIIEALNTAFARDSWLRWRLRFGRYQKFWGKMSLLPLGMAAEVRRRVETMVWEDDLEIDRVIREADYGLACLYVKNPRLYRQSPPVFDEAGLRAVIDRTLHYSLNIPGEKSLLEHPLDIFGKLRRALNPRFAAALKHSEAVTAACRAEIETRLAQYGASWVDWGAYRYAVRVGDPLIQVWKYDEGML